MATKDEKSKEIKEIEIKEPIEVVCNRADRVCDPESMFEMIEQCRICGRCV